VRCCLPLIEGARVEVEEFDARRSCRTQRHPKRYACRIELAIFTFMLFFLTRDLRRQDQSRLFAGQLMRWESRLLTRVRDVALLPVLTWRRDERPTGRCTPGEAIASGFSLYPMFLRQFCPLLIGLPIVASVWLAFWLVYLFFGADTSPGF